MDSFSAKDTASKRSESRLERTEKEESVGKLAPSAHITTDKGEVFNFQFHSLTEHFDQLQNASSGLSAIHRLVSDNTDAALLRNPVETKPTAAARGWAASVRSNWRQTMIMTGLHFHTNRSVCGLCEVT